MSAALRQSCGDKTSPNRARRRALPVSMLPVEEASRFVGDILRKCVCCGAPTPTQSMSSTALTIMCLQSSNRLKRLISRRRRMISQARRTPRANSRSNRR
jgi:hypothetical protein